LAPLNAAFKDLAEFDAVATSISMVMTGIDPETKLFTDPQTAIKKEIDDAKSDESILPGEKEESAGAAQCCV
jgi:hypothetical protein